VVVGDVDDGPTFGPKQVCHENRGASVDTKLTAETTAGPVSQALWIALNHLDSLSDHLD
jgi:hypothetical protein